MFQSLLDFFAAPAPDPELTAGDEQLALATLLVRVARADDHYDAREKAMIAAVLQDRFNLPETEAAQLLSEAEVLEHKAPDTVRFTKAIKDAVAYEDRAAVVEALWRVALADGSRGHEEDGFLRLVVNLLGVNDRDSGLARQRVIRDLGA